MKRAKMLTVTLTVLAFVGLLGSGSVAEAGGKDWGFQIGIGDHGVQLGVGYGHRRGYRRHHHHRSHRGFTFEFRHDRGHRHVCTRAPIYESVWVAPVYRTVVVGYRPCGTPIFESVIVTPGYYTRSITGYHCSGCGRHY